MSANLSNHKEDDLKQDLDEDLSQLVHDYQARGLSPGDIVDSLVWHGEVAMARSDE